MKQRHAKHFILSSIFALLIACFAAPSIAHACTSPAGTAGEIIFNDTHNVHQYCDGTDWIAMSREGRDGAGNANMTIIGNSNFLKDPRNIVIVGDFAYVITGDSNSLVVIDISTPGSPVTRGHVIDSSLLEEARGLSVVGNYAYVASEVSDSLTIIDISNPDAPNIVGSLVDSTNFNSAHGIDVVGNYAYIVGALANRLSVVDISDPTNPTLTGVSPTSDLTGARDVKVIGNYAYVAAYVNRFTVMDISNPAAPVIANAGAAVVVDANLQGAHSVDIVGNYAYVTAQQADSFTVIDISDPLNPAIANAGAATITSANLDQASDAVIVGNYAYVAAERADTLAVVDISDPLNPTEAGTTALNDTTLNGIVRVAASGTNVFSANDVSDLVSVIDISTANAPSITTHAGPNYFPMNELNNIEVSGGYAYVTADLNDATRNRFMVFDVRDPTKPNLIAMLSDSTINMVHGLLIYENFAYVKSTSGTTLTVVDISDPYAPFVRGSVSSSWLAWNDAMDYKNGYIYATAGGGGTVGVLSIDVRDPDNIVIVDTLTHNGTDLNSGNQGRISGNYYFTTTSTGLNAIDISDPNNLVHVGQLTTANITAAASAIDIHGDFAYICQAHPGPRIMTVVDISDPTTMVERGTISHDNNCGDLEVTYPYVFVSIPPEDDIHSYDVSDPDNPTLIEDFTGDSTYTDNISDIEIVGNYIYAVTQTSNNLSIIDMGTASGGGTASTSICAHPDGVKGEIRYDTKNNQMRGCTGSFWEPMGPQRHIPNAVTFDGTNDWLTHAGPTAADSKTVTGSFWIRTAYTSCSGNQVFEVEAGQFNIICSSGVLILQAENSGNTDIADFRIGQNIDDGEWHHILFSFDLADQAGSYHRYVNDAAYAGFTGTYTDDTISIATGTDYIMGSNTTGSTNLWPFEIADFWIDFGTFIDLSEASNRRRFINADGSPVNLGSAGQRPTGESPEVFLSGDTDNWHSNKGTGGGFTENGELTTPLSQPGIDDVTDGLIGWWKLDETSGTIAVDSSGQGNNGTMLNGLDASDDSVAGVVNTALNFDGVNARVEVPHNANLNPSGTDLTVSFWMKPSVDWNELPNDVWRIICKAGGGGDSTGWYIAVSGYNGESIRLNTFDGTPASHNDFSLGGPMANWNASQWYHIVVTIDGANNEASLYVDSVFDRTTSGTNAVIDFGTFDLLIGDGRYNGDLEGVMDDVRLYDRELTATEIETIYNAYRCENPGKFKGTMTYNTTSNKMQYCNGGDWIQIGN